MSEDMLMMLLRIVIIVFPAGFACFLLGFFYGRGTASKVVRYEEPMEWQEPVQHTTRLTSRNKTLEF
jgi:hypothetical protein